MSAPKSANRFETLSKPRQILLVFGSITLILLGLCVLVELLSAAAIFALNTLNDDVQISRAVDSPQATAAGVYSQYDPWLGYRFAPYTTYIRTLRTNGNGIIANTADVPPVPVDLTQKDPAEYRIFVLGGSTAAGWQASGNQATIPANLERMLNESTGEKTYRVINAGVSGYFSPQELVRAELELVYYQPDMIVVLDGLNEFMWSSTTFDRESGYRLQDWSPNRHAYHDKLETSFEQIQTWPGSARQFLWVTRRQISQQLFARSYTVTLLKFLRDGPTSGGEPPPQPAPDLPAAPRFHAEFNPLGVRSFKENLVSLIGAMQARNIRVVVLLQPNLSVETKPLSPQEQQLTQQVQVEYSGWQPAITKFYAAARQMFAQLNARYHTGTTVWIEDLSDLFILNNETLYADQYGHYNDDGNRIIAERIREIVQSMTPVVPK